MLWSHVSIQEWFWVAYLVATLTSGISALQLQRPVGPWVLSYGLVHAQSPAHGPGQ